MSEAPSTVPVCYRHSSVPTYVRCTRCDRPICPRCMTEAAVGFQCPECVAQGRATQRQARTAFGGSRVGRAGYATITLITVNVLIAVASLAAGGARAAAGGGLGGLLGSGTPVTAAGEVLGYATYGGAVHGIAAGEWWRLVTAMFLHYGLLHLALNMWALWQLGRYLEAEFGPLRFVALYLTAGLGGNVASYLLTPQNVPSAGASTAVFGLMAALFVANRRLKREVAPLIPLLVVNIVFTFTVPNISVTGHLGGLVTGAVTAAALAYAPRANRTLVQTVGCLAVLALLGALTVYRTMVLLG